MKYKDSHGWADCVAGSSGLSNRLIRCILFLLKQLLDVHIWCKRIMLHQIESIAYGL